VRRREFIRLIGGAAAWPLATYAQQPSGQPRIGILMTSVADSPDGKARIEAFLQGMQQLGWTDGRNIQMDIRWSGRHRCRDAQKCDRNGRPRAEHHLRYRQFGYGRVDASDRSRADRIRNRS